MGDTLLDWAPPAPTTPPWMREDMPEPTGCLTARTNLFFPWTYGLQCAAQIEEAKALCQQCPLREECLEWAIPNVDLDGIFGGLTPPERRRLRVGRRKQRAA